MKDYSALNAGELRTHLTRGRIVEGVFAHTVKGLDKGTVGRLVVIDDESQENRFIASGGSKYPLFRCTRVFEYCAFKDLHKSDVVDKLVRLKRSVRLKVAQTTNDMVYLGDTNIMIDGTDLLELFEFENGATIGDLVEVEEW